MTVTLPRPAAGATARAGVAASSASSRHLLGPVTEIPVGEGRAYAVAGEQIAVFHLPGGVLRAVSAVCPHRGGPIADGQIDRDVVICPLHANVYELATGCSRTGQAALRAYPVRLTDGGDVEVTVA